VIGLNRLERIAIKQEEAGECGLACIAMISRNHNHFIDVSDLRRRFPLSSRGASLKDLVFIADSLNFHTRALRSDIESLSSMSLPAILHWDLNHFVVLENISSRLGPQNFTVLDPSRGVLKLKESEFSEHFTGIVLEMTPAETFLPRKPPPKIKLTDLWSKMKGFWSATGRVVGLSVGIQIVALAMPFYMQATIDSVLPGMDMPLMYVLAASFMMLVIINALTSWIRLNIILNLSSNLIFQSTTNLFRQTLSLPIAWFEKRHLGDVISRFGSLQPVSDLLSKGLVSAVVDGGLALTTLVLMFLYSGALSWISLGAVFLYCALRLLYFTALKNANANALTAQAVESTTFIESIRGVNAIKSFCQEGNRQRHWQNKKATYINATLKLGKISGGFDVVGGAVIALEGVVFILVGVQLIKGNILSLGMLFALQAYKQNFMGSVIRLIDQAMNYRLLDVHLSRVSDLVREEPEHGGVIHKDRALNNIELRNVSFSYGIGLPAVLKNVNLKIDASSSVALVGPSGSGKTTLLKILGGLLTPTEGEILIDGIPLKDYGLRSFRSQLGVVSQEDVLFSGTLAENIAFFDPAYTMEAVVEAADVASVSKDIAGFSMKYETRVGDMGSNLSGGQRQRVVLARAVYASPRVLLLDEATAHLDIQTEQTVLSNLSRSKFGRIMVAHRPDAYLQSSRIIHVSRGGVSEISPSGLAA
jgi:ATP-binding cassette subfamily B protein RaxB